MRLRRLDLARYGKFTDRVIDFGERIAGEPDLHIVYGPNEAGKSTAFAGFLDLLFGMELQSRYGFLHPYETMRVGGCLELSGGRRELVRIKKPQPTLRDKANDPVPDSLILGELGGLDRNAYRTMFSLDDDTLEAGGKSILASNGELGQLLFSASAGLSELSRMLLELRQEAEGFTRPRGRDTLLQQLKAEIGTLRLERDAIDTLASEYNRLAAARDGAQAQYEEASAKRARAQTGLERMRRLLAALPRMAALRTLRVRLAQFAELPAAPPGWLAELPALEQAESRHRTESERVGAEVRRLAGELNDLVVDERALRLANSVDRLNALRARHLTAELDLPERRQGLARADGEVAGILERLGRAAEADPRRLLLTSERSATLDSLIADRSGIEAAVAASAEELSGAVHALNEAKRALNEASGEVAGDRAAASLTAVIAALATLDASDHAFRLRNAVQARARADEVIARRLAALAPWHGSIEALAALTVPDAARVAAWNAAFQCDDALVDERRADVERLEAELDRRTAERDAAGASTGLVSDGEAVETRRAREAAWAEHRRTLDVATADAFEAALRRDDMIGSARLGRERELARLHEAERDLAARQAEARRARKSLDEIVARRQRQSEVVAQATAAFGPELASPARLLDWISRREKALEAWEALRAAEREARAAEGDAAELRERLLDAMRHADVMCDPRAALDEIAAIARTTVEREQLRRALRETVAECEREVRSRELALQKTARADKAWQAEWRAACSACWLGEEAAALPIRAVRGMLAEAAALGPALRARAGLADRISAMEHDQAALRHELDRLVSELGVDPGPLPPSELAQAILDRVQDAVRADERKRGLADALAAARDRERAVAAEALIHARRVAEMTAHMGADSLLELAGRLRDAELKSDLKRQAAEAERDILATLQVENLDLAEAMLASEDAQEPEVGRAGYAAEFETLDQRTRELYAASLQAAERIAAVGGDDAAARIEERRQTKLLELAEGALRHIRLRAGIAAADRALRAYRDKHRSAMMNQASEVFSLISRGAYRGLSTQPDRDGEILVAVAADGASKLAADLSKGTRFQLYLALRAAGYWEFARLRPPVPFIADDIIETFDDLRAEETLRVLADMAKFGQVIYLTHHDHLRAMAERAIPGVRTHHLAA